MVVGTIIGVAVAALLALGVVWYVVSIRQIREWERSGSSGTANC